MVKRIGRLEAAVALRGLAGPERNCFYGFRRRRNGELSHEGQADGSSKKTRQTSEAGSG